MKLVPLFDRVVLKQLVAEETTKSGIVLPGQAKEKPQQAEVIAVGPGGVVDGKEIKMQVKPGDKVIYSKYSGFCHVAECFVLHRHVFCFCQFLQPGRDRVQRDAPEIISLASGKHRDRDLMNLRGRKDKDHIGRRLLKCL